MNKKIFIVLFFSCPVFFMPFISCSDGGDLENAPLAADSSSVLDFSHRCHQARVSQGYWQSYALFSNESERQTVAILGNISVGFVFGIQDKTGINLELHKIRMEGFDSWIEGRFTIALQFVNSQTNEIVTGDFNQEAFQVNSNGGLLWEFFTEPESEKKSQREGNDFHPLIPEIRYSSLSSPEGRYEINLILKTEQSDETIVLFGPSIENLKDKMSVVKKPESSVLGLFGMFNPFEEGSVWGFFRQGFKEKGCINLRKKGKKQLDQLF